MTDPFGTRVLLVDDDADDALLTQEILRDVRGRRYDVRWVCTYDEAREALLAGDYDVALLDYRIGARTGLDLLKEASSAGIERPLILITGQGDRDVDQEGMRLGAADYLPKGDITPSLLERSIRYTIERTRSEALRHGQARVLEMVARGQPLEAVLTELILTAEAHADLRCAILLSDADGTHLRVGAAPSLPMELRAAGEGMPVGPTHGSCGSSAYRRETVVVSDVATDPLWEGYRDIARRADVGACWSRPVISNSGAVLGTVCTYYRAARGPTSEEEALIASLGQIAAIAIERIQTEAALREGEQRLRQIAEHTRDVVWIADAAFAQVLYVSPSYELMWGRTTQSLHECPLSFLEVVHPEDRDAVRACLERASRGAESRVEFRILRTDGQERWLQSRGVPVLDGGFVYRVVGVTQDITERKEMEMALRESERRFRSLAENSPDIIARFDQQFRHVYINPVVERITGISPATFLGKTNEEMGMPEPQAALWRERMERAFRTGEPVEIEFELEAPHGVVSLETRLVPERGTDGRVEALLEVTHDVTNQKRAAEQLKRKEEYFRSLIEYGGDLIALLDSDHRIRFASPSVTRLLGYSYGELLGKGVAELIHPEDLPSVVEVLQGLATNPGRPASAEYRILHKDGFYRVQEAIGNSLLHDPNVAGIVVNARDVTERKKSETALRESEERFQQLAENIDAVFWLYDLSEMRTIYCNSAFERIWGVSKERVYEDSRAWAELLHPEDRLRVLHVMSEHATAGYSLEYRIVRPDGEERWILDRASPVRDASGVVRRVAGVAEDITEQKRMEAALRESEARFRALAENATEAIITINTDDEILFANPAAVRVFGYSAEELQDLRFSSLMPERMRARHRMGLARHIATGERHVSWSGIELPGLTKSGQEVPLEITFSEFEADGRLHFTGVMRDITERKRVEEQLRLSQRMEAVGRLAGGVAHDFNNLLMVIDANTRFVLEDLPQASPSREDLEEVQRAAEKAASLTQQLLAFSRKQVMEPQLLSLNDVVQSTEKILRRLIREDVELITVYDPKVGVVRADPAQIDQVLINLVVNARDAMPDGGTVRVSTGNARITPQDAARHPYEVHPGEYVVLSVEDTGTGMDEAILARAFEPFFTTKEPGEGTGLGLSTVYGIVKQSEGYIWAASRPGQGTTFHVYLPRVDAEAQLPPPAEGAPPPGAGQTVLVVEDEHAVRALTRRVLERAGYHVLDAGAAEDAIAVAAQYPGDIHLLLTDVVMPRMGGRILAEHLAASRPGLRTLFMSGYLDDAVLQQGVEHAGLRFLQKPIRPDRLLERVALLLGSHPIPPSPTER